MQATPPPPGTWDTFPPALSSRGPGAGCRASVSRRKVRLSAGRGPPCEITRTRLSPPLATGSGLGDTTSFSLLPSLPRPGNLAFKIGGIRVRRAEGGAPRTRKMASRCPAAWARALGRAEPRGAIGGGGLGCRSLRFSESCWVKNKTGRRAVFSVTGPFGKGSLIGKAALPGNEGHFLQPGVLCPFHRAPEHRKPFFLSFFLSRCSFHPNYPRPRFILQAAHCAPVFGFL